MDTATRERLVAEGRTRWMAVSITTEGRRFPSTVNVWAIDENDAAARITLGEGQTIARITEQHR